MLLGLFALEHLVMCSPMFILYFKINERNLYLDTMYGQLKEEQVLTVNTKVLKKFKSLWPNFTVNKLKNKDSN